MKHEEGIMAVGYEVMVEVREDLGIAFERYMREKHIPEILATGCFTAIVFEQASSLKFRTRYEAATQADLDCYLAKYTDQFRADFMVHFPIGCTASREVWAELHRFPTAPR